MDPDEAIVPGDSETTEPAPAQPEGEPKPDEAAGLTGDENEEEIKTYLDRKYSGKGLRNKDRAQILRWRAAAQEGKANARKLKELEKAGPAKAADSAALALIAQTLGPGHPEKLKELGPEEYAKFILGDGKTDAEPAGDDPRDRRLQELENWKTQQETSAKQGKADALLNEKVETYIAEVDAQLVAQKVEGKEAKELVGRVADSLYTEALGEGKDPDDLRVADFVKQAKELLHATGKTDDGKPNVPKPERAEETEAEEAPDTRGDPELAEFLKHSKAGMESG